MFIFPFYPENTQKLKNKRSENGRIEQNYRYFEVSFVFFQFSGESCQPPMPAVGYQHNPVPMTANVPSQFSPPNSIGLRINFKKKL